MNLFRPEQALCLARYTTRLRPLLQRSARRAYSAHAFDTSAVRLLEVGPRDGLQNIAQSVATSTKVELIRRLHAARLDAIEATSFVSPRWIPQLADSAQVMEQIRPLLDQRPVRFPVLVPNMKGFERASQNGAREIVVFASASEGFSRKNTNCSIDEALQRAEEIAQRALAMGIAVRGVVSCIFACPYDGPTDPAQVLRVVQRFLDMGCFEVALGDTLGVGTPSDVRRLLRVLLTSVPVQKLAGHYHDTYGQAVANVVKSYEYGIRAFDSAIAGLGGCPYAKGARGNLATEDVVYTLERAGVKTGVDLDQLVSTGQWISQELKQPNGSRAGSAIYAKDHNAQFKTVSLNTTPSNLVGKSRPWTILEENGEYTLSRCEQVVKITLTRPKHGNAMTNTMVDGLAALFTSLAKDPSTFHIVLCSEGKYFCTGMDLSASGSSASTEESDKADYYSKIVALFNAIDHAPQTTIAAIDGPCFGGGVGLAFACDIRLASEKAKFTLSEVKLGVTPAIISKHMTRELGPAVTREAMLTAREMTAQELHRLGAIHAVVSNTEELNTCVESYLDKLKHSAPRAAAEIKELVRLGWKDPDGEQQEKRISTAFATMLASGSEGEHGMQQFRQKIKNVDWAAFHSKQKTKGS